MLCAKEIKGLCEAGSALGYKDDELWEFVKGQLQRKFFITVNEL